MTRKVRKNFVESLKYESNKVKTFTENGAISYESSGKYILDFNFKLSQYRNMSENDIYSDFTNVYFENPILAVKFIFYVGDVREGLGERKIFRTCMRWLAIEKPQIAIAVLHLIPEYTRWDNLINLVDIISIRENVLNIIYFQLKDDINKMSRGESISLLAKWMPSINASSRETRNKALFFIRRFNMSNKEYRKILSSLRSYLDIVEIKASSNKWSEINYSSVPSQANLKYHGAFLRHDYERRQEYLNSLKSGKTKINAFVLQPHEIVNKYRNSKNGCRHYNETFEQLWKNLKDITINDTLVIRDGSYSMTVKIGNSKISCLDVATALAIYCSEHNSDEWKDKFITFSSMPRFIDLSQCKSLSDKLCRCYNEDDCSNTDIEATMRLILNTAINNKCSQKDMPKNILIISDMQFDSSRRGQNWNETLFESIKKEYENNGYLLPKIIFWNVCSRNFNTIPMQNNELGLILCSGFSTNTMKMFMTGENPYKILMDQINDKRYDPVEKAIIDIY